MTDLKWEGVWFYNIKNIVEAGRIKSCERVKYRHNKKAFGEHTPLNLQSVNKIKNKFQKISCTDGIINLGSY